MAYGRVAAESAVDNVLQRSGRGSCNHVLTYNFLVTVHTSYLLCSSPCNHACFNIHLKFAAAFINVCSTFHPRISNECARSQ